MDRLFSTWGKEQQAIPADNESLKTKLLAGLDQEISSPVLRRIPWVSVVCAGLAIIALIIKPGSEMLDTTYRATTSSGSDIEPQAQEKSIAGSDYYRGPQPTPPLYYPYDLQVPINDTREFMKMTYRAQIQSRDVNKTGKKIQNLVHSHKGRIDSLATSEDSGSITFVLPATEFDTFQDEINALIPGKMLTETITATNLLPQKQALEAQDKSDKKLLDDVATVYGTVSLRHISAGEAIDLYAGPYWIPGLLLAAAVISYLLFRRRRRISL